MDHNKKSYAPICVLFAMYMSFLYTNCALAQTPQDWGRRIADCTTIQSDIDRLRCFDESVAGAMGASKKSDGAAESLKILGVADLSIALKEYIGKTVGLQGWIRCLNQNICQVLDKANMNMFVGINFSNLSANDISHLILKCGYSSPCTGTVYGKIAGGYTFGSTITATNIIW